MAPNPSGKQPKAVQLESLCIANVLHGRCRAYLGKTSFPKHQLFAVTRGLSLASDADGDESVPPPAAYPTVRLTDPEAQHILADFLQALEIVQHLARGWKSEWWTATVPADPCNSAHLVRALTL